MKLLPLFASKESLVASPRHKLLLFGGILSSLLYVAMNIIAAVRYEGYSSISQTVSELSAIGAPTRTLWVIMALFYSFLITAFAWAVLRAAGNNHALKMTGMFLLIFGIVGFFWPPMHQRTVLAAGGGTITDILHIVFAFITVPLMILSIGYGAKAFGRNFQWYSITTLSLLLVFGTLTAIEGPKLDKGLPTPYIGIWERINIGVFLVWVVVLAVTLLNIKKPVVSAKALQKEGQQEVKQRKEEVAVH